MSDPQQPLGETCIPVHGGVTLTGMRRGDEDDLVAHLQEPRIYQQTLRIPFPYTRQHADQFLTFVAESTERQGYTSHFAIRDAEERLIGACGFESIVEGHCAEIGYWLAKPFWAQGIMTRVVAAAGSFAQTEWNLMRIAAHVFDGNVASLRVLQKNGFQFEGCLRKYYRKDGCFRDARLYALVR
jgi:RimJ/RimL family protein N-acetyltransferase